MTTWSVPRVSVLMPTFRQRSFVAHAIRSLLAQSMKDWELVVVDDGSPDDTAVAVEPFLRDGRIRYVCFEENRGLGAALNAGLDLASADTVAYLPSDDVFFTEHLASLLDILDADQDAVLAYSGVRRHVRVPGKGVVADLSSDGLVEDSCLQLVQVLHRRTRDRWIERSRLVTDDLDRMLWSRLRSRGTFAASGRITCQWTDHPLERHKLIREPLGGLYPYRSYYRVAQPLRFHSTVGNPTDEARLYRRDSGRPGPMPAPDGLRILLVGELSYNPERVLALEERGHRLFGLWIPDPLWFNAVGPFPFGHIRDLSTADWRDEVRSVRPDLIYALLNWGAVPLAHEVLSAATGIPLVWHLKESPFDCVANGTWPQLVDLYTRSDGQIYSTPEVKAWFDCAVGERRDETSLVLDGDLPKRDWFTDQTSPRLSEADGTPHTVVLGGPVGFDPVVVKDCADQGIHIHFYGDFHRGHWSETMDELVSAAPDHCHFHGYVDRDEWVPEISKYDAGWLHLFQSRNRGDPRRAVWEDLNYPSRMPTLAAAGVPFIQHDNRGSMVATQELASELDVGLFYRSAERLAADLRDGNELDRLRANLQRHRSRFTFDWHADRLIAFFRETVERCA